MRVLKSWLKDYIDFDLTNDELISKLSLTGTDVESLSYTVDPLVIIMQIEKIRKHPNADKLQIVEVFDGKEKYQVVCGAENIAVGQKVPLAKVGSRVNNMAIKEEEIRGVKSTGMLCSESELGIGTDHSGIKILPDSAPIGKPLAEFIESDLILDLEITPNRGDCLSHIGIARGMAAIIGKPVRRSPVGLKMNPTKHVSNTISVKIENTSDCPRYFARKLSGVKIGPSPKWLTDRLIACGSTPINNIVDVTNYIMLDLGQPLHAFDAERIAKNQIFVRRASNREEIVTFDGKKYQLSKDNLVIADTEKPIAIAGIIGGLDSGINKKTNEIIIEAAEFNPKVTRKSAKSLDIVTEASFRFERGIDSGGIQYAIDKAAKMMMEVAGGEIFSGIIKAGVTALHPYTGEIAYRKINNLLGLNLSDDEINHILKSLGFLVEDGHFVTPSWRHDIECWQDLAEEVGRIYGYDKIKPLPLAKTKQPAKSFYYFNEHIKDLLADLGLVEVYNYSYLSRRDCSIANTNQVDLLAIKNPIQQENRYLRNSLIPGILKNIAANSAFDEISIFEIGNVFSNNSEKTKLCIAIAGKKARPIAEVIADFSAKLDLPPGFIKPTRIDADKIFGIKLRKPFVDVVEIETEKLFKKSNQKLAALDLKTEQKKITYRPVSKYPSLVRDLAFIVDSDRKPDELISEIYQVSDIINRVELFDEFISDKFGKDKKNLAFHIFLQVPDRTLKDSEVGVIIKKIVATVEKKYRAQLRK